jgi:hypothetical protein
MRLEKPFSVGLSQPNRVFLAFLPNPCPMEEGDFVDSSALANAPSMLSGNVETWKYIAGSDAQTV